MILFLAACESQVEQGANDAAVCSTPPSAVGIGITDVGGRCTDVCARGRK
jgi:hypothetical protein